MRHSSIGRAPTHTEHAQHPRPEVLPRGGSSVARHSPNHHRARCSTTPQPPAPCIGHARAVPRDRAVSPTPAARSAGYSTVDDPLVDIFKAEEDLTTTASLDSIDLPADAPSGQEDNPYTPADAPTSPIPEGVGELELERLLAEKGADLSVERVCKVFPYPLDNFQKKALEMFLEGQSVVVCAPTGAGKTAIAEAAAAATLARGQRVIYTTPLKALSNQKLFEMRKRFGHVRCGLQTGDSSLNTEASVVIMTTEILRNIMYRIAEQVPESPEGGEDTLQGEGYPVDQAGQGPGEGDEDEGEQEVSGLMTREVRLADVGLVVMDEVHYLSDPFRGSVWEEAIINCPRHIQLLCMSATVKNPDDLGAWIAKEHMPCATIKTSFRPVPLHWYHAYTAPPPRGLQLVDLLSKDQRHLNQRLEAKAVMMEEARAMLQRRQRMDPYGSNMSWDKAVAGMMEVDVQMQRKAMSKRVPAMEPLILRLRKENLLPAIWFIMSRKDCDLSAVRAAAGAVILTSEEEQQAIRTEVAALQADSPEAVRETLVPALIRGMASHHAGHLPGWKSLVERLFQRGLLKIVFATGTLAAGINMPARTTIISALGRRTDDGVQLLPHNELLQMAGRAGRRGYDTEGFCCVLQTRYEGPEEAFSIIKAGPEPLMSHFNVSYGLVLNLLSIYSLEQAREFCNRSFGIYLRREGNARRAKELEVLEARIAALDEQFAATASTEAKQLNASVKAAKEQLRLVRIEEETRRMTQADEALMAEGLPRKVLLNLLVDRKGSKGLRTISLPAVLLAKVPAGSEQGQQEAGPENSQAYVYLGLGADNRLVRVNAMHVAGWQAGPEGSMEETDTQTVAAALDKAVGWGRLAARLGTVEVASGNSATALVALQLQQVQWQRLPLDNKLLDKINEAKTAVRDTLAALESHRSQQARGGNGSGQDSARIDDKRSMDRMAQARSLQKRADKIREEMQAVGQDTWRNFTEVVDILADMGAILKDSLEIMPLGLVARSIQGQNELWLALVLTHPAMFGLSGPELAGVLGAILCGEVVRKSGNISAAYMASQKVVDAVNELEGQRQLLSELQAAAGLGTWNDALLLDLRLAGIVEAWAAGATWKQVVMDSGMDDGDIARLLIRTVDLIKQISWQKELLPHLTEACFEALKGLDRKPIAETLM